MHGHFERLDQGGLLWFQDHLSGANLEIKELHCRCGRRSRFVIGRGERTKDPEEVSYNHSGIGKKSGVLKRKIMEKFADNGIIAIETENGMNYLSVAETAKKWGVSERTVRNYCAKNRIPGAFLTGKTWNIPEHAVRPQRAGRKSSTPQNLLEFLKAEKDSGIQGGIYHKIQIDLTYNSNHMEGSCLSHDQTRFIFETNTIGLENEAVNLDDVIETANHFRCIDLCIEQAEKPVSESFIKLLHLTLKNGTSDSRKNWFAVGDYKKFPNEVGGRETALPEEVAQRMKDLLRSYNSSKRKTLEEIIAFHYEFESIHPFQDGNGRVGRLILFKECLRNQIVPFMINEDLKMFYCRGLSQWKSERGYLMDTCLTAQDQFKAVLNYFRIPWEQHETGNRIKETEKRSG